MILSGGNTSRAQLVEVLGASEGTKTV